MEAKALITDTKINLHIQNALRLQCENKESESKAIYEYLIRKRVKSARLYNNYAALLYKLEDYEAASKYFRKAALADPNHKDTWSNLQVDCIIRGPKLLLSISGEVLARFPCNYNALIGRSISLREKGDLEGAYQNILAALEEDPYSGESYKLLAHLYMSMGDPMRAIDALFYAISLSHSDEDATILLSEAVEKVGDPAGAIKILEDFCRDQIPSIPAMNTLALLYQRYGYLELALHRLEIALGEAPNDVTLLTNKANCLREAGDSTQALQIYKSIFKSNQACTECYPSAIFLCSVQGADWQPTLKKWSRQYWCNIALADREGVAFQANCTKDNLISKRLNSGIAMSSTRKLPRICFLTGDFGGHVVSSFMASVLMNYRRDSFDIDVVSSRWGHDPIAESLSRWPSNIYSIAGISRRASQEFLVSQNYDIIIETSGFTGNSSIGLLSKRCAPIQAHWIGYHASTYLDTIDYFIGDSIVTPPENDIHFSEDVVRLNRAWLCPTPFNPIPNAVRINDESHIKLGCFCQMAKITSLTLDLWASALSSIPRSELILKDRLSGDRLTRQRIADGLEERGIRSDRITFLNQTSSWQDHMLAYNTVDIALDTSPWASATTAFDAVSMGVPLVSFEGNTMASRMSASVVTHLGKRDWCAKTVKEYGNICKKIAEDTRNQRKYRKDFQSSNLESKTLNPIDMWEEFERTMTLLLKKPGSVVPGSKL